MKKILACMACALTMCAASAVPAFAAQEISHDEPAAAVLCEAQDEILTADVAIMAEAADGVSIVAEAADADIESSPEEGSFGIKNLIIGVVAGIVITAIIMFILASQLKSVTSENQAKEYVIKGSFKLTGKRDIFLYKRIEKKEKPKND